MKAEKSDISAKLIHCCTSQLVPEHQQLHANEDLENQKNSKRNQQIERQQLPIRSQQSIFFKNSFLWTKTNLLKITHLRRSRFIAHTYV
jgi:hypothetical protein